jgi:hypothetical protein
VAGTVVGAAMRGGVLAAELRRRNAVAQ